MIQPEKDRLLHHIIVRLTLMQTVRGEEVAKDDWDVDGRHVLPAGHGIPGATMVEEVLFSPPG